MRDYAPGQVITKRFVSIDSAGNKIAFSGSPTLRVIRSDALVITAPTGITLSVNLGGTGRNMAVVDTSVNLAQYLAGYQYTLEVLTGTVDGRDVVGVPIEQWTLGQLQVASWSDAAVRQFVGHAVNSSFLGTLTAGSVSSFTLPAGVTYIANEILEGFCIPLEGAGKKTPGRFCTTFNPTTRVGTVNPNFLTAVGAGTLLLIVPGGPVPTLNEMAESVNDRLEAGNLNAPVGTVDTDLAAVAATLAAKLADVEANVSFEVAMRVVLAMALGKSSGFASGVPGTGLLSSGDINGSGDVQGTKTRLQIIFDAAGNRLSSQIVDSTPT